MQTANRFARPRNFAHKMAVLVATVAMLATTVIVAATPAAAQATTGLILNEWNGVAQSAVLADGAVDPAFGNTLGNGGDWFEMVVTQPGGLDLRGWTLSMADTDNTSDTLTITANFTFSNINALANVPAGTIITVSEDQPDNFDLSDNHMNLQANDDDDGQGFTSLSQRNFDTNSKNWQLTVRNTNFQVVYGPAGEGVNPVTGVGNEEVGKLEVTPSNAVTPQSTYNDGTTSTFGAPNIWDSGTQIQDFTALTGQAATASADAFIVCQDTNGRIDLRLSNPTAAGLTFTVAVTGLANSTHVVPAGNAVSVTRLGIPDGTTQVAVSAGGSQIYSEAFPTSCDVGVGSGEVILNEWNAVKGSAFLENGSSDTTFGRIEGNGGDWFEMVVVGPGGVDLRGWTFQMTDTRNDANLRVVTRELVTSQLGVLSNVPAGTIITVSESQPDDLNLSDNHINLQANDLGNGSGFTATSEANFDTSSADWNLTILDAAGNLVYGPAGEAAPTGAVFGNVSGFEVGKLEANPSPSITPQSAYNDGSTSTFGAPNLWSNSTRVQDFSQWWGQNPDLSVRSVDCAGGLGIVRFNVMNNYAVNTRFTVTTQGQLTDYSGSKDLFLDPGEEGFVGFSGRPDELYNAVLLANGKPVAAIGGLTGATTDGAVSHCGDAVAIVDNRCANGSGTIAISHRNDGATTQQFRTRIWYETQEINDQAEVNFGGIERFVTVPAGATEVVTISGRSQDIGLLLAARSGNAGFTWASGTEAGNQAVLIDCQGETDEVGVLVSCLQLNGRLDIFLNKPDAAPTEYRVTVSGPNGFETVRTVALDSETSGKVTVTGRPDGSYPIVVEKLVDGSFTPLSFSPSALIVSCDLVPTIPVTLRSTCLLGNGRIDVVVGNTESTTATYVVQVVSGAVTPRTRVVPGEQRSTVTVTGRPDGSIPVVVTRDGVEIFNETVLVACD